MSVSQVPWKLLGIAVAIIMTLLGALQAVALFEMNKAHADAQALSVRVSCNEQDVAALKSAVPFIQDAITTMRQENTEAHRRIETMLNSHIGLDKAR